MTLVTAFGDTLDRDTDGVLRCAWGGGSPLNRSYHDCEWGRAVTDDRTLFEKLCLEGFQAGLSWATILRKREAFRLAFANFDVAAVAAFDDDDVSRLLDTPAIVRHRGKIESAVNNARRCQEVQREQGSLAAYAWSFAPPASDRPALVTHEWLRAHPTSATSTALSKDLKRRGWTFVGPTTVYAFMQAMGLVNDHQQRCFARSDVEQQRSGPNRQSRPNQASLAGR